MFLIEKQTVRILIQYIVDYACTMFKARKLFILAYQLTQLFLGKELEQRVFNILSADTFLKYYLLVHKTWNI